MKKVIAAAAVGVVASLALAVPAQAGPVAPTMHGTVSCGKVKAWQCHTVRKGDTLWAISKRYYGSGRYWPHVAKTNRVKGTRIYVGQRLAIIHIKAHR